MSLQLNNFRFLFHLLSSADLLSALLDVLGGLAEHGGLLLLVECHRVKSFVILVPSPGISRSLGHFVLSLGEIVGSLLVL